MNLWDAREWTHRSAIIGGSCAPRRASRNRTPPAGLTRQAANVGGRLIAHPLTGASARQEVQALPGYEVTQTGAVASDIPAVA